MSTEERTKLGEMKSQMCDASAKLEEMERELPASNNGIYLSIILGSNLNVSLLNPDERYRYKQEYESFKMNVTYVILALFFLAYMFPFRYAQAHTIDIPMMRASFQSNRCLVQFPPGVVLLHPDHPRVDPAGKRIEAGLISWRYLNNSCSWI